METQQPGIEKYHNDEKVMREVKSISGREIIERPKSSRNLRIGGTDRREHKLIYQKEIERGKKE